MIFCKPLNKNFESKKDMFVELKANEHRIISLKKAQIFKSHLKGQISDLQFVKNTQSITKELNFELGFVYPVINTTRYMDSHDDVHFDGIWNKTLKDNVGKIYYANNHKLDVDNIITWPENVHPFTMLIDWGLVGKQYPGQTEALVYKIKESDFEKESALKAIINRRKVQGSVSMIYKKITLAVDSNEKDYTENKSYFDSHINMIANKENVYEQGYFFGVDEAAIWKEGSMVIAGSNDATEIIYPDMKSEPLKSTQKDEPPPDTHVFSDFTEYFNNNFKI